MIANGRESEKSSFASEAEKDSLDSLVSWSPKSSLGGEVRFQIAKKGTALLMARKCDARGVLPAGSDVKERDRAFDGAEIWLTPAYLHTRSDKERDRAFDGAEIIVLEALHNCIAHQRKGPRF